MTKQSHIEQLIHNLCPSGVKYTTVENACIVVNAPKKLATKEYQETGMFPIIDQGKEFIVGYTDDKTALLQKAEYVLFGDHTREVKFVDFAFAQGADGLKILVAKQNILPKYLYYCLQNLQVQNRGYNRHWSIAKELQIPIAPMPIQKEIVSLLDSFTNLLANINAEIGEEQKILEIVKKHLFDNLSDDCDKASVGDLLDYEQPYQYIVHSTEYDDKNNIPVLTAGQTFILGYTDETDNIYPGGKENPRIIFDDFTTSIQWVDFPFKVKSSAMKILKPKDNVNIRYVYYAMTRINYIPGEHARQWISRYSTFEIPYPSLEDQQAIAAKLDTIEAFIANLNDERTLRQQQYEYYRAKLISLLK